MSTAIVRTLEVGDIIAGNPCRVHVFMAHGPVARGMCETCEDSHLIDRAAYEAGEGPWTPADSGSRDLPRWKNEVG